jgi:ATP-binding cassette, subfamily B, multidrug efflux pump
VNHIKWMRYEWRGLYRFLPILLVLTVVSTVAANGDPWLAQKFIDGLRDLQGTEVAVLREKEKDVTATALSPRDGSIVLGLKDGTARILDADREETAVLDGYEGPVRIVAFSPSGDHILTVGKDETVRVWTAEGAAVALITPHDGSLRRIAFSPDGDRVVIVTSGAAWLMSLTGGEPEIHRRPDLVAAAILPEGLRLLTISDDGAARILDAEGNEISVLRGHEGAVLDAIFSPDGATVATASADHTARLWNLDGEELAVMRGHEDAVRSVAFTPTGDRIITASDDKTDRLWRITGRELSVLPAHSGPIGPGTFSPDGMKILIPAINGAARLWNVEKAGDAKEGHALLIEILELLGGLALLTIAAGFYPAFRALINNRIEVKVRERYFASMLEKDERFFQKFRTGDLVTRLMEDIYEFPKIAWFCCSGIFRAVDSFSKFLFCAGLMMFTDWKLALIAMAPLPLTMVAFYFVSVKLARAADDQRKAVSRTNDMLESCFSGVRILKAFSGQRRREKALETELTGRIDIEMRLVKLMQLMHSMYSSIDVIGVSIAFTVGGVMAINGQIEVGELIMFIMLLEMIGPPLLDIPHLFSTSRQAFVCMDRLEEIREFESDEARAISGGGKAVGPLERVDLEGVAHAYEENPVLNGVTLRVQRGERAAIVGRVGSGKSTLLRILAGLVRPQAGHVVVNDAHLSDCDLASYRRAVGYVPQEPALFSETIRDNVIFGREERDGALEKALETACVLAEVNDFPDGTETVLGQRGQSVSGGQKQRLNIARALYGHPELLLMDDVTAGLDAENEELFWDRLSEQNPEATCVVVTHRIATARRMDRIHVLEDGRIIDSGTHEELVARCDLYREFQQREDLRRKLTE